MGLFYIDSALFQRQLYFLPFTDLYCFLKDFFVVVFLFGDGRWLESKMYIF